MKPNLTLKDKLLGFGSILLLCTLLGGGVGYLTQTGLFHVIVATTTDSRHIRRQAVSRASRPVTKETYERRTQLGWRIGCATGFVIGSFIVIHLSREKRHPDH